MIRRVRHSRKPFRAAAVLALALALLFGSLAARAQTLVIAGDPWCPVNCEPDSERPGIFVELARDIFGEAGIEVEYRVVNWARALHAARKGQIDAVIGAAPDDAPGFLFTPTPVSYSRMCFFTRSSSRWRYTAVDDLHDQRLGAVKDYSYGSLLDDYLQTHGDDPARVQLAHGDQAFSLNVDKLLSGRIDVMMANAWVMENRLREQGRSGRTRNAGCRSPDLPIYLAFSPAKLSSPGYVELFEAGMRRYRADGRLERLLKRYGVSEP